MVLTSIYLWLVVIFFGTATLALSTYGLHLYFLLLLFRRRERNALGNQRDVIAAYAAERDDSDWPMVTTQIPIYNENDVARRIMEAVAAIDYPQGRHEIQVLDDSDDDTRETIDRTAARLCAAGADVKVIRRADRSGFKAGALNFGLKRARGQYIAIFDADFVPPENFLQKAVPLIDSAPKMACLQGRWSHLNRNESWLTETQALGIDGHFAVEQGARAWNGLMMNFNGTAGVWRKAAIEDPAVGGWNGDTLTEDLDLSYRAQLAGWKLDYCFDLPCPAELPGTIEALKSQQRRWATGSIQVACKLLPRIWKSDVSLGEKVEATLHLTHYSVALWMLILALVARPMLLVFADDKVFGHWFWVAWTMILLSAFAPSAVYTYARYRLGGGWSGLRTIPSMLILGCGMCVNNTIAVVRGLYLHGGEFVRTPKSGSEQNTTKRSSYALAQNKMWLVELILGVYSLVSFFYYFNTCRHRAFSFFLLLYAIGFLLVGWMSRPRRTSIVTDTPPMEIAPLLAEVSPAESTGTQ